MPRKPCPPSGRTILRGADCDTRVLGTDRDYARLPVGHPLVFAEMKVGNIAECEAHGTSAAVPAAALWRLVAAIDKVAQVDAAQLLVGLGIRDFSCLDVGLEAATWLVAVEPAQLLWRAYRAGLLACAGDKRGARETAAPVLADLCADGVSWMLASDALRRIGRHTEARRGVMRRLRMPQSAEAAARMLARWHLDERLVPMLSDRTADRFAHREGED